MVGTITYYITFPVVAPLITVIALMDQPKSWKEFKNNFILIYGGKYV
jgi:ABC-type sugar transport system permease subunit